MTKGIITHLTAVALGAVATFGLLQLDANDAVIQDSEAYAYVYEVSKLLAESVELDQGAPNSLQVDLTSGRSVEIDLVRKTISPLQGIEYFEVTVNGVTGTIDSNGTYVSGDVLIALVDTERYSGKLISK